MSRLMATRMTRADLEDLEKGGAVVHRSKPDVSRAKDKTEARFAETKAEISNVSDKVEEKSAELSKEVATRVEELRKEVKSNPEALEAMLILQAKTQLAVDRNSDLLEQLAEKLKSMPEDSAIKGFDVKVNRTKRGFIDTLRFLVIR